MTLTIITLVLLFLLTAYTRRRKAQAAAAVVSDTKILVCSLIALCNVPALSQTSDDLQAKYGRPVEGTFPVRPGLGMRVKYADDGRVCEMVVEELSNSSGGTSVSLSEATAEELINELVPAAERGEKEKLFGLTLWLGQEGRTLYNYDNVAMQYLIRSRMLLIRWQNRGCEREETSCPPPI